MRSRLLISVFLLAWMSPLRGDTIENFVILNSSNPSVPGGTFDGGGTYSGSFSFDASHLLPYTIDGGVPLLKYNIRITAPFANIDLTPANSDAFLDVYPAVTVKQYYSFPLQLDTFIFVSGVAGFDSFTLSLLEPDPGTFHGGLVELAEAGVPDPAVSAIEHYYDDTSGSAIVIDPAVVPTPEPNFGPLLAGGLCVFAALTRRRR